MAVGTGRTDAIADEGHERVSTAQEAVVNLRRDHSTALLLLLVCAAVDALNCELIMISPCGMWHRWSPGLLSAPFRVWRKLLFVCQNLPDGVVRTTLTMTHAQCHCAASVVCTVE